MTRSFRYWLIALAIACVAALALPFHIATMEWVLLQGDQLLSLCEAAFAFR